MADERFGDELIETLQAYFDASENVTGAARRLNPRDADGGLPAGADRILLGHPLDVDHGRRLRPR